MGNDLGNASDGFGPLLPECREIPFDDLDALERALSTREIAAFIVEPIQGKGVVIPRDGYLPSALELCRRHGTLFIADEIQTGIGRTGRFFGYQHAGVTPDIVTVGKGIGGGVPLAALIASGPVSCFEYGDQGGTFGGNPLMAAVGCAVVETVAQPEFLESVASNGAYLMARLRALAGHLGHGDVRGRGLLLALELKAQDAKKVSAAALDGGLLVNAPRPDALRFMPALTVSRDEIDAMLTILEASLGGRA